MQEPPAAPKRKRGRENVRDMVLSLTVCVGVIVPVWFLAQPPPSDSARVRVVDTSGDVAAFRQAAPGVPVPGVLPEGWRPTSSTLEDGRLRIGYVTPDEEYAEYAAQAGDDAAFLEEQTGRGRAGAPLTVGGRAFTIWSSEDDSRTSLVATQSGGTVVVGGLRETAEDDELTELAASLR